MTDLEAVRALAEPTAAALEASRRRIDDLNVYPVPDGDTGTNLALTARAIREALDAMSEDDRETLARQITRAALMGARGNSGVILSQIIRGFADVLGSAETIDSTVLAAAFRSASDAAYRAVRHPVEGTMLTVIRELAEEAEERAAPDLPVSELLKALVRRGEDALARTPQMLDVLREAGVVDAGGAGLLELVRGLTAAIAGEPLPEPAPAEELPLEAVHQELSRFRYCTVFVVEREDGPLEPERLEAELDRLGDSLLVVGDESVLKAHVHTDDPGAALSAGVAQGTIEAVEIANMHRQTAAREERLVEAVPEAPPNEADVVAVVSGSGNKALYESLGAARIVEGGRSMNPSTADIVAAIEKTKAPEAIVLPNNSNVILTAEQAVALAAKQAVVVPTSSLQAGLAAMVAYDGSRSSEENATAMRDAAAAVATGAVTIASRDVQLDGLAVRRGDYLGLLEGEPVAGGKDFDEVAQAVVERLLAEPHDVLTLLTGEEEPSLERLLNEVEKRHPQVELEVHSGGQPLYHLLISAE